MNPVGKAFGLDDLERDLANAARTIDLYVSPEVHHTLDLAKETQIERVAVDSGKTRDSIKVTGLDGAEWTPTTVNGEAGPTWFVGALLEHGTATMAPKPFVEGSLDPHMEDHKARTLRAATNGALRGIVT